MQVDGHQIAVDGGAIHDLELGVVLAQAVELALHLFLGDGETRQSDRAARRNPEWRRSAAPATTASKDTAPLVLAAGDVDLGLGDRVELGVDDGPGVEVGQRLAQRLGRAARRRRPYGPRAPCAAPCRAGSRAHVPARARVRTTSPSARSNSGSSTSTLRRTRFPSIGSAVARITSRSLYRPSRGPGAPSIESVRRGQNMKFMAPRTAWPIRASPCSTDAADCLHLRRRGPTAPEAHEVDARQRERHRRRHVVVDRSGAPTFDGDREGMRPSSPGPAMSKRTAVPSAQLRLLADDEGHGALDAVQRDRPRPRSRSRPDGRGRGEHPARAPSCRRPAPS